MRFKRKLTVDRKFWHPWFAWYPVAIFGRSQWVWLEWIHRKGIHTTNFDGSGSWSFIYRAV
jgi:hypothetical protein